MTTRNKIATGIRITRELDEKLTQIARYLGLTKNGLIVKIIWDYIEKQSKEEREMPEESRCTKVTEQSADTQHILSRCARIVVETDAKKPVPIAIITDGKIDVADGYRVRLKPVSN